MARPILAFPDAISSDGTPLLSEDAIVGMRDAQLEKLPATYRQFQVDENAPGAERELLITVLERYVTGWHRYSAEVASKSGPKPEWSDGLDIQLYHTAKKLVDAGTHDLNAALLNVKRKWKLNQRVSTLQKHYYRGSAKYARSRITAQKHPDFARLLGIEPLL